MLRKVPEHEKTSRSGASFGFVTVMAGILPVCASSVYIHEENRRLQFQRCDGESDRCYGPGSSHYNRCEPLCSRTHRNRFIQRFHAASISNVIAGKRYTKRHTNSSHPALKPSEPRESWFWGAPPHSVRNSSKIEVDAFACPR